MRPGARRSRAGLAWVAALGVGCGTVAQAPPEEPGTLAALAPVMLRPGEPFEAPLVEGGPAPDLELVRGALPKGLFLTAGGLLKGTPELAGEHARFTVRARGRLGEPLGQRDYFAVVGVTATNLPAPPAAARTGDVLTFHHDWGRQLSRAWGWDPVLGLVWPMRVGAGFVGKALAPASSAFGVVVAGPDAQGHFVLPHDPLDERALVVAQLTWSGDADVDLHLVADAGAGGVELSPRATLDERDGQWVARHEIAELAAPGPEVLAFAAELPPGRWALVATKASGPAVEVPLWLSVRRRDGAVLAERRVDALFSDVSSGSAVDDEQARTQSYRPLDMLVVGPDHDFVFEPVDGGELLPVTAGR